MGGEEPSAEFIVVAGAVEESGGGDRGEHAEEGFELIASHGVADEGEVLVAEEAEEGVGLESRNWGGTGMGFPSVEEVVEVGSAMGEAVLAVLDRTAAAVVVDWSRRLVPHPFPLAVLFTFIISNISAAASPSALPPPLPFTFCTYIIYYIVTHNNTLILRTCVY